MKRCYKIKGGIALKPLTLKPSRSPLSGELAVPGDKSISHRAIIFGSLAKGTTIITNFLDGEDCLATIQAFKLMGVDIEQQQQKVTIRSKGIDGLTEPLLPIDLGNSGTTARLLLGVLAGLPFHTTLYGDQSLTQRPMDRIAKPLEQMGAKLDGRERGKHLPIAVRGQSLKGITFRPQVKSAQVKSGVLLAGLLAEGKTTIIESTKTRDHTENMLTAFGGKIEVNGNEVTLVGKQPLTATTIQVPGDISSAAFFIVAALLVPNSEVTIKEVGLNHTRTGILDALAAMNVELEIKETAHVGGEVIGSITIRHSQAYGAEISGDIIPRMIDELPIIALLATQAKGKTIIRDAEELRYKETNRIDSVVNTLTALGADVQPTDDGMIIEGGTSLKGTQLHSYGDHRIGMMIVIASLICEGDITLTDADAINVSYPRFFEDLKKIT